MNRMLFSAVIALSLTGCAIDMREIKSDCGCEHHKAHAAAGGGNSGGNKCRGACCSQQAGAPQATAMPVISPVMSKEEMMVKAKEAATPSAGHRILDPLVGRWKAEVKMWMDPTKPPTVSQGSSVSQWILGGRYIREDFSGSFNGEKFEGISTVAFDNVTKNYLSTWIDTLSTGMMVTEGKYNVDTKTLEMSGNFSCPMVAQELEGRTVTKINNTNSHVFEMYSTGPDGKEAKVLEITYTRQG